MLETPVKALSAFSCSLVLACGLVASLDGGGPAPPQDKAAPIQSPAGLPAYDHVVIVVEENKDYEQIIDNPNAPYINLTLRKEGANFTQVFGEEHKSQGNYFWLFSGSNQGVGFNDEVPSAQNNKDYPFRTANLGAALIAAKRSFKGYAEDLPAIGSCIDLAPVSAKHKLYARKHVPWISFANVPNGDTVATSSNLRFADFPTDPADFKTLPTVAFVIPNLDNDMHNGAPAESIPRGDAWLKKNLGAYYQWAREHNSLLILTWDESDDQTKIVGLTDPFVKSSSSTVSRWSAPFSSLRGQRWAQYCHSRPAGDCPPANEPDSSRQSSWRSNHAQTKRQSHWGKEGPDREKSDPRESLRDEAAEESGEGPAGSGLLDAQSPQPLVPAARGVAASRGADSPLNPRANSSRPGSARPHRHGEMEGSGPD